MINKDNILLIARHSYGKELTQFSKASEAPERFRAIFKVLDERAETSPRMLIGLDPELTDPELNAYWIKSGDLCVILTSY